MGNLSMVGSRRFLPGVVRWIVVVLVWTWPAMDARAGDQRPRIERLPSGLAYEANCTAGRPVFPDDEMLSQRCYFRHPRIVDSIAMNEYAGARTADAIRKAHDAAAERSSYQQLGPVEEIRIDGRDAFGWLVRTEEDGRRVDTGYVAVVPYDDVTFTVSFHAGTPGLRSEPVLREVVSSFKVPSGGLPFLQISVAVAMIAGVGMVIRRLRS